MLRRFSQIDNFYTILLLEVLERGERKRRQKHTADREYSRSEEQGWRVFSREPRRSKGRLEISKLGARYGLSRISSLKRQNNAKNVSLIRHGSTSSPNDRGAGSVEKDIKLFYTRLLEIPKIDKHNGI